jgi:hypothetical protein
MFQFDYCVDEIFFLCDKKKPYRPRKDAELQGLENVKNLD